MSNNHLEKILGLSKQEATLYGSLSYSPNTVAEIAKIATLPRMTSHYILRRLLERELVKRRKHNKHFLYYKTPKKDLLNVITEDTGFEAEFSLGIPITSETDIEIHKGFKRIFNLHKKIAEENAGERVYTIQTSTSTKLIVNAYSDQEIHKLHAFVTDNKIIAEDIVEEDFFDIAKQNYKGNFSSALSSFVDRMSVAYMLPKNYISFQTDMALYGDTVLFTDWKKKVAIEIRNKEIVAMCLDFFNLLKEKSKKIEYREIAKKYF